MCKQQHVRLGCLCHHFKVQDGVLGQAHLAASSVSCSCWTVTLALVVCTTHCQPCMQSAAVLASRTVDRLKAACRMPSIECTSGGLPDCISRRSARRLCLAVAACHLQLMRSSIARKSSRELWRALLTKRRSFAGFATACLLLGGLQSFSRGSCHSTCCICTCQTSSGLAWPSQQCPAGSCIKAQST